MPGRNRRDERLDAAAVDVPTRWALGDPPRAEAGRRARGGARRGGAAGKPSLRVAEVTGRVGGGRRSVPRSSSAQWFKDGGGVGVGGAEPREGEGRGGSVSRREAARRLL